MIHFELRFYMVRDRKFIFFLAYKYSIVPAQLKKKNPEL